MGAGAFNDERLTRVRCAIVLAAGEGQRLSSFVRQLRGDSLPKQYTRLIDSRSMLEQTFRRVEKLIPRERLITVIARHHLDYPEVRRQLSTRPPDTVVAQPLNRETAPGILLPLMYVCKRYPDAAVAVFPSDHFVSDDERFIAYVEHAFRAVEADPLRILLLGVEPDGPDPEYGYIVPGESVYRFGADSVRRVELFVEKPGVETARKVIRGNAVWNTLVMVFRCGNLLGALRRILPELYHPFETILGAIGTADESNVIERVYGELRPINFSTGVLEALPHEQRGSLLVLPMRGVGWSDLGSPDRLLACLRKAGKRGPLSSVTGARGTPEQELPGSVGRTGSKARIKSIR